MQRLAEFAQGLNGQVACTGKPCAQAMYVFTYTGAQFGRGQPGFGQDILYAAFNGQAIFLVLQVGGA